MSKYGQKGRQARAADRARVQAATKEEALRAAAEEERRQAQAEAEEAALLKWGEAKKLEVAAEYAEIQERIFGTFRRQMAERR